MRQFFRIYINTARQFRVPVTAAECSSPTPLGGGSIAMWSSFQKNILILSPTSATRRISAVSEDHSCIPYWSDSVLVWQAFIVDWQTTSETENRAWFVIIYMYYVLIAEILTLFLPASRLSYKGPWWIIKNAENCMVSNIKTICTKKTKMHEEKIKHGHWPINMKWNHWRSVKFILGL